MWELDCEESWAPRNWCFWTVVLEKTLEIPWTARRSNQSILKETSPGCSLEGLMLKLKLQYFGHLMRRVDSFEKTLMLGGIGGRRRRGRQRMRWLDRSLTQCTWVWVNSRSWWWTGRPGMLWFMGSQRVGHDWVTELNWMSGLGHMLKIQVARTFICRIWIKWVWQWGRGVSFLVHEYCVSHCSKSIFYYTVSYKIYCQKIIVLSIIAHKKPLCGDF